MRAKGIIEASEQLSAAWAELRASVWALLEPKVVRLADMLARLIERR